MADSDKNLKFGIQTDAGQAISELDRYNAKLKAMADAEQQAAKAAKELGDAEAYAALKIELKAKASERAAGEAAEVANANQEAAKTVKVLSADDVKAALAGEAATTKWTASKAQAKAALKGLSLEVPILGRAWAFISNPITASIAGIAGGIAIWRMRMRELTATFAETEIASVKVMNRERVNAVAVEWENFGKVLDGIKDKFDGLEAKQDRMLEKLKQQTALVKNLAGDLDPVTAAALGEDMARREAYGESKAGLAFGVSARNKEAEARRLTDELNKTLAGVDPKTRAEMLAGIDADNDAAKQDVAIRGQRLKDIEDFENAGPLDFVTKQKFANRYGWGMTSGGARQLETDDLKKAEDRLAANAARRDLVESGGPGAARKRATIAGLLTGAAADREKEIQYSRRATGIQSDADLASGAERFKAGLPMRVSPTGEGTTVSPETLAKILESQRMINETFLRIDAENRRTNAALNARQQSTR